MIIFENLPDIPYGVPKGLKLSKWISEVIESEGVLEGEIIYKFVNDEELLEVNKFYLQHYDLTDIITFGTSNSHEVISGNIFISYERVKDNSKNFNQDLTDEFLRVVVHGVLHLMGYDDKTEEEKQLMRSLENKYTERFI